MTETREQVVARVTAAVDGAADGAFGFDRPKTRSPTRARWRWSTSGAPAAA